MIAPPIARVALCEVLSNCQMIMNIKIKCVGICIDNCAMNFRIHVEDTHGYSYAIENWPAEYYIVSIVCYGGCLRDTVHKQEYSKHSNCCILVMKWIINTINTVFWYILAPTKCANLIYKITVVWLFQTSRLCWEDVACNKITYRGVMGAFNDHDN